MKTYEAHIVIRFEADDEDDAEQTACEIARSIERDDCDEADVVGDVEEVEE